MIFRKRIIPVTTHPGAIAIATSTRPVRMNGEMLVSS
jgi:hypothetical protein